MRLNTLTIATLIATIVTVVATIVCSSIVATPASAQSNVPMWQDEFPIRQPWLRDNLPDDALLYARIPNLYGLLATPKGSPLDPALRSTANVENLKIIRKGMSDSVFAQLPAFSDLRIQVLERLIRSPIEIANFVAPAPSVLIAINVELNSNNALHGIFETLSLGNPEFRLVAPLDARGIGQVEGLGVPLFIQFHAGSGRLLIHAGPGVNYESFVALLQNTVANDDHQMRAMERRIDEGGQGIFVWINSEQAIPAMQMFMPPEQIAQFTILGLDKVRSVAFGMGVANGKGRLAIVADVPSSGGRGLLPFVSNDISALSAGDPDALVLLAIPTADDFSRIESLALESATAASRLSWLNGKDALRDMVGVSIEEILGAIGPELLLIFDPASDYAAIRLRNAKQWAAIVARVAKKPQVQLERKRIAGTTYNHMSWPGDFALIDEKTAAGIGWFATLLQSQREHFYWVQDGEFLYFASAPQALIDRERSKPRTNIGTWLHNTQRIDSSEAVLVLTGTNRKLPRRFYMAYIEILQFLAEIAEVEIDVWSMPTADQLQLADKGALSFSISLGDPIIAMELAYESNPFEVIASGGFGGIAITGILAAIAIPAYQDYTIRAKVAEGLNLSGGMKAGVTEYYMDRGQFPDASAALQMSVTEDAGKYTDSVIVIEGNGNIVIGFKEGVIPSGGELFLYPEAGDGVIEWTCSSTIENKWVPAACRD